MLRFSLAAQPVKLLAACLLTTLVGFAACGSDDQTKAQGEAGSDAGGDGGVNVAGSQTTPGGDGPAPSGGASAGAAAGGAQHSSGGAATGGAGGEPGVAGEASLGGTPGSAGDTGAGGALTCEIGDAKSPAAPGTLDLFGQIAYFGSGEVLPAGRYRVSYVDGCMKYSSTQDWAIHAYGDGSIAWWLGKTSGEKLVLLPGSVGIFQGQGGYSDFEACVAANQLLAPVEFDFDGGVLGIWLADSNYIDNLSGVDGRNPSWKLTQLGESCN